MKLLDEEVLYERNLLFEVLKKSFCANLYRSVQILADITGFVKN